MQTKDTSSAAGYHALFVGVGALASATATAGMKTRAERKLSFICYKDAAAVEEQLVATDIGVQLMATAPKNRGTEVIAGRANIERKKRCH